MSLDHKQFLFVFCRVCKVDLALSNMETVDRSPELHLEEIKLRSLSEPADTETSGGRPAETSAETLGGRPAEDGHTASPTSHTGATKRISTWKVVYYGSALIIVLAVWTMALLPSVLIFRIVRSPVQVIYMYRPGYHLHHNYVNPHQGVMIVTSHAIYKVAVTWIKSQLPNMAHL